MAIDIGSFMGAFNDRHHEIQNEREAKEKSRRAQIGQWLQSVYSDPNLKFESVRQKARSAYNDLLSMAGDYTKPYKLPKDVMHPEELMHPSQVAPAKQPPPPAAGEALDSFLQLAHAHNAQTDGTEDVPQAHELLGNAPTLLGMPMAGAEGRMPSPPQAPTPVVPPVPGKSAPAAPALGLVPPTPQPQPQPTQAPLPALGGGGGGGATSPSLYRSPEEQLTYQSGLDRQKALADLGTQEAVAEQHAEFLRKQGVPEDLIPLITAGASGVGGRGGSNQLLALTGAGKPPTAGLFTDAAGQPQSVVGHFNQVTKTFDTMDGQHLPAGQVHMGPFTHIPVTDKTNKVMWQTLDAAGQPVGKATLSKPMSQYDVRTVIDEFNQPHTITVPRVFYSGGSDGNSQAPSTPAPSPAPAAGAPAPKKLNLVTNPRAVGADGATKPVPKAADNTRALAGLTPQEQSMVKEAVRSASTEGNGLEDLKKTFTKPAAFTAATQYAADNNIALLSKEDRHVVSAIADAMTVVGDVRRYVKKAQDSSLPMADRIQALAVLKKTVNTFRVKLARGAEGANGVRLTQAEASWANLLPGGDNIDSLTIPLLQSYTQDRIDQLVHDIKSFQQNIFDETHQQYSTSGEKRGEPAGGSVDDVVSMIKRR